MTTRFDLPSRPWTFDTSGSPGSGGHYNLYVSDASGRKICSVFGKRGEQETIARAIVSVPRLHDAEIMLRNIIFNVEQNPKAYTASEIIRNMRQALGLKEGERP